MKVMRFLRFIVPMSVMVMIVCPVSAETSVSFEKLPSNIKRSTQAELTEFFKQDLEKVQFDALAGGMSGTPIYKTRLNDISYVIRVHDSNEMSARKVNCLSKIAGEHGVGPRVLYPTVDKSSRLLITDFVTGKEPSPEHFESYQKILASSLRQLHSIAVDSLPRGVDLVQRAGIEMNKVGLLGPFLKDITVLEKIDNALILHPYHYGLTHQDLNTLNCFIVDGKSFSFIDWVNGGFGDVMGDVANMTLEFGLNNEESIQFLKVYLDNKSPTKKQIAQFELWRKAAEFRLVAWAYEKMHSLGGVYAPAKAKWTVPQIVKKARSGQFDPKTAEDFQHILNAAFLQWQSNLDNVNVWIEALGS